MDALRALQEVFVDPALWNCHQGLSDAGSLLEEEAWVACLALIEAREYRTVWRLLFQTVVLNRDSIENEGFDSFLQVFLGAG